MTSFDEQIREYVEFAVQGVAELPGKSSNTQDWLNKRAGWIDLESNNIKQAFEQEYLRRVEEAEPVVSNDDPFTNALKPALNQAIQQYQSNLKNLSQLEDKS
jgi:hypothetical protein